MEQNNNRIHSSTKIITNTSLSKERINDLLTKIYLTNEKKVIENFKLGDFVRTATERELSQNQIQLNGHVICIKLLKLLLIQ